MKKLVMVAIVSLVGSMALADQCAFITKPQAEKAVKALLDAQSVQSFCEPCGEVAPKSVAADSLGLRKAGYKNLSEVVINGEGIDLAYTFVNGLNLAKLVGCPAKGVSASIK